MALASQIASAVCPHYYPMLVIYETCRSGIERFRNSLQDCFSNCVPISERCTLEEQEEGEPLRRGQKGVSNMFWHVESVLLIWCFLSRMLVGMKSRELELYSMIIDSTIENSLPDLLDCSSLLQLNSFQATRPRSLTSLFSNHRLG